MFLTDVQKKALVSRVVRVENLTEGVVEKILKDISHEDLVMQGLAVRLSGLINTLGSNAEIAAMKLEQPHAPITLAVDSAAAIKHLRAEANRVIALILTIIRRDQQEIKKGYKDIQTAFSDSISSLYGQYV